MTLKLRNLDAKELAELETAGLSKRCIQMLKDIARKSNHSTHKREEIEVILDKESILSKAVSDFQYLFGGLLIYNNQARHCGLQFQLSLDLLISNALRRNQFKSFEALTWPLACGSDPYLNGQIFIDECGAIYYSEELGAAFINEFGEVVGGSRVRIADSIFSILEAQSVYVECSARLPYLSEFNFSSEQVASLLKEFKKASIELTQLDRFCYVELRDNFAILIRKVWAINDEFHVSIFSRSASLLPQIAEITGCYKSTVNRVRFHKMNGWVINARTASG